jgi:hypothetical protein
LTANSVMTAAPAVAACRHVICGLARTASCGYCRARPHQPCVAGGSGMEGCHVARFVRAARRGLITPADLDLVLAAAGDGMFDGAAVVPDGVPGGWPGREGS